MGILLWSPFPCFSLAVSHTRVCSDTSFSLCHCILSALLTYWRRSSPSISLWVIIKAATFSPSNLHALPLAACKCHSYTKGSDASTWVCFPFCSSSPISLNRNATVSSDICCHLQLSPLLNLWVVSLQFYPFHLSIFTSTHWTESLSPHWERLWESMGIPSEGIAREVLVNHKFHHSNV